MSLASWVNDLLGLDDECGYKEGTMRNWLHLCGFGMKETKKGCYYDGHEREDVIKVRKLHNIFKTSIVFSKFQDRNERFIPQLFEILEDSVSVDQTESGEIVVVRPEASYIIVNQDEKIHHSNEVQKM